MARTSEASTEGPTPLQPQQKIKGQHISQPATLDAFLVPLSSMPVHRPASAQQRLHVTRCMP